MTENEFIDIQKQKEKELFNPIISGSLDGINMLELITSSTLMTLKELQKKEGNITHESLMNVISGVLTSWENREMIKKKLMKK